MKRFRNVTNLGNEKALRKGRVVPEGDVNLAYYKSPALSPDKNVIVLDTSQTIDENRIDVRDQRKVYYANALGILEDFYGNQVIRDKYPVVGDVFSVDEDFSFEPNVSEYTPESILPFVHISRYFHIDYAGLVPGFEPGAYFDQIIKVVDAQGRDYVTPAGTKRYRIMIAPAAAEFQLTHPTEWAYRVYAYVDAEDNEELYLTYNKIEVTEGGVFSNQQINFKELLPLPARRVCRCRS
jgi:hypothetical protein